MKRKLLPFLVTVAIAAPTFAQTAPLNSEADVAMNQVEAEIQDKDGVLNSLANKVEKTIQSAPFSSKIEEEISKYRIQLTVDALGGISNEDGIDSEAYYQYVVEPAFRNNEQMRKDIWVINLRGKTGVLAAGTQVRLTFIRYFGGKNAKRKAAFAPVKWFWEAPMNTNDIKTKLAVGEGYRFEVNGDIAIGKTNDSITTKATSATSLSYKRAGTLIVDLYKVTDKAVRGRFIGMKNRGEVQFGVSMKTSDVFSSAPGKLKDLLSIGFGINFRHSILSLVNPLSLDTLMMDNLFNFSTTESLTKEELATNKNTGEAALEEILHNMKNGKLASVFLLFTSDGDLMKSLREKTQLAESIAKVDLEKYKAGQAKFSDLRVYNYFKGRMTSVVRMSEISGRLSGLVGGSSQSGSISSHVSAFDTNENMQYFWLDNSFTIHKSRALFGRNKYNLSHDLDVLVQSDAQKGIGRLQDVVVRTQVEDTEISNALMENYRTILKNSLPDKYTQSAAVDHVLAPGKKTNAYFSIRQSFGEAAFKAIGVLDRPRLAMKVYDYLDKHPQRSYMHLPSDQGGDAGPQMGLGTYAEQKAYEIANIFEPSFSNEKTMEAFRIAKRDPIFERYLVSELFSKLLPQQNPDPYFGFDLKFSSAETGTRTTSGGANKVSGIYDAVSFMRSIITDQSMDMQMTSSQDHTGNTILTPVDQQHGFIKNLMDHQEK